VEINGHIKEAYDNKLKNKLFGLLCEFEKDREWEKFLDSILIELLGYPEE
jgi:predicted house-cleaning noncanonical NTP pyrophosphatase (MazG superfamily)